MIEFMDKVLGIVFFGGLAFVGVMATVAGCLHFAYIAVEVWRKLRRAVRELRNE